QPAHPHFFHYPLFKSFDILGHLLQAHGAHDGDDFGPLFNCCRAHPFFAVWLSLSFCPQSAKTDNQRTLALRFQPTRKRTSRMVLAPKRCFSLRRISVLEICSSS